jgi:hypothetical protein
MVLDVVVDLDRAVAAKIVYVVLIVVEFRFVKAVGQVLVVAKVADAAPVFTSIGLEISQFALIIIAPLVPILLAIRDGLVSLR